MGDLSDGDGTEGDGGREEDVGLKTWRSRAEMNCVEMRSDKTCRTATLHIGVGGGDDENDNDDSKRMFKVPLSLLLSFLLWQTWAFSSPRW